MQGTRRGPRRAVVRRLRDGEKAPGEGHRRDFWPLQAQQNIAVGVLRRVVRRLHGHVGQHAQLLRRRGAREGCARAGVSAYTASCSARRQRPGCARACLVTRSTARSFTLSGAERHLTL